jgi:nicotinamidase-related amidase
MSDRTALLVIDMQIGLVEGAFRADAVLDRIADLIGRARSARVLRRLDVTHVVVTGTQTEFCVDTTCRRGDVTFGCPSPP